ncbi:hypothetical protein DRQ11_00215 [candidate division KSB1 bacterium]|nr:MAG: hypothetical protein DRQ11_00215 [candidate division KSB1 bacterium]
MNYFTVRKYQRLIMEFENLVYTYWQSLPQNERDWVPGIEGVKRLENDKSFQLRQLVAQKIPAVEWALKEMGVSYIMHSYPAPAVGGPVVPVSLVMSTIDPNLGHSHISNCKIIDMINIAKGQAAELRRKYFWKLINPFHWLIEGLALIVRFPFLVLRRAGLPPKVEENLISQIIKGIFLVGILLLLLYKGIKLTHTEIFELIKKWILK